MLGEISISGTMIKVDELANTLQCCLDSGAKKVLIPSVSMMDFATVPADLMGAFQLIPYSSAEDAVLKRWASSYFQRLSGNRKYPGSRLGLLGGGAVYESVEHSEPQN